MKEVFRGACTALITPMKESGVDYAALEKLIEFQIENKIDALLACGTTGEPSTMSESERREVISFTVKTVKGRVPVLAGTGCNNTASVIEGSKAAEKAGADALLVVTPYYNKATQNGLIAHYTAVAGSTSLPVIAYNVPGRTGVNILPKTMEKLSSHKNIAGIKEASGNMEQICELSCLLNGKISLYSGDDGLTLPVLSVGGSGIISVVGNIVPRAVHDLTELFFGGKIAEAQTLHRKLFPLSKAMFLEVNPIPVKTAASLLGFCGGTLRLPLTEMEEQNLVCLKSAMRDFGLVF